MKGEFFWWDDVLRGDIVKFREVHEQRMAIAQFCPTRYRQALREQMELQRLDAQTACEPGAQNGESGLSGWMAVAFVGPPRPK